MRSTSCAVHAHDSMVPVESHHVWPVGMGGPNVRANRVQVCANAHSDTHYLLDRMLDTGDAVPWIEERTYGPKVRALARLGYEQVMSSRKVALMRKVTSPTKAPVAKVQAAGLSGAIATLLLFVAHKYGWDLTVDNALLISGAVATIAAFAAGYFKRPRFEDVATEAVTITGNASSFVTGTGNAGFAANLDAKPLDDDELPHEPGEAASL